MRQQRRNLIAGATNADFSAAFTGTARLSAANTGGRFNPANSTALTVAAFVYPTQLTAGVYYPYVRTVGAGGAATDGWYIQRAGATNQFEVGYSNGSAYFNVDAFAPVVNTWYLVIGTWFNTGVSPTIELRVYSPAGVQADSTNTGTGFLNTGSTAPLYLGGDAAGSLPGEARIDKVRVWGRALTAGEPDTLWNGGIGLTGPQLNLTSLMAGLLYAWDLDEASGTASWPGFAGGVSLTQTGTVTRAPRAGQ